METCLNNVEIHPPVSGHNTRISPMAEINVNTETSLNMLKHWNIIKYQAMPRRCVYCTIGKEINSYWYVH